MVADRLLPHLAPVTAEPVTSGGFTNTYQSAGRRVLSKKTTTTTAVTENAGYFDSLVSWLHTGDPYAPTSKAGGRVSVGGATTTKTQEVKNTYNGAGAILEDTYRTDGTKDAYQYDWWTSEDSESTTNGTKTTTQYGWGQPTDTTQTLPKTGKKTQGGTYHGKSFAENNSTLTFEVQVERPAHPDAPTVVHVSHELPRPINRKLDSADYRVEQEIQSNWWVGSKAFAKEVDKRATGGLYYKLYKQLRQAGVTGDDLRHDAGKLARALNGQATTSIGDAEGLRTPNKLASGAGGKGSALNNFQTFLDVLGLVPVIGEPVDLINAAIYEARGQHLNAALSATSAIPFWGWLPAAGKIGSKAGKELLEEAAEQGGKHGDEVFPGPWKAEGVAPRGAWQNVNEAMSARARAYRQQITGRSGQSFVADGVKFDGLVDDVLVDAKGPGYSSFVKDGQFRDWFRGADELADQAQRQLGAANGSPIRWHVAEEDAAQAIRNLFADRGITGIDVIHTPVTP